MKPQRTCRLSADRKALTITQGKKSVAYTIEDLHPDAELASHAFRFIKPDGKMYTVHADKFGLSCDCEDMHYRKAARDEQCKHIRAAVMVGLLPEEEQHATVADDGAGDF